MSPGVSPAAQYYRAAGTAASRSIASATTPKVRPEAARGEGVAEEALVDLDHPEDDPTMIRIRGGAAPVPIIGDGDIIQAVCKYLSVLVVLSQCFQYSQHNSFQKQSPYTAAS